MGKHTQQLLKERNKPLKRVTLMFIVMFMALGGYIVNYSLFIAPSMIMNDYNPRLSTIENSVQRGDILDRNGEILATTRISEGLIQRVYPYNNTFAHVIGYVEQGKTGLESYCNLDLLDTNSTFIERLGESLNSEKPKGNSIVTTLDKDLQLLAHDLLGDNKGAIVALEPTTGKVLAMVSTPDYDPNTIAQTYQGISTNNEQAALLNRATQGLYPPGSTFKIITTIAYLENNAEDDFFYYCLGEDIIDQKTIHCYNNTAHGRMSLEDAFSLSCNTSFAHIGETLDPDRLREIGEVLGYNQHITMELPVSMSKLVLDSNSLGPEIIETAIGQGKTLATPLNSAMIVSAIANGGVSMSPYIVDQLIDDDLSLISQTKPKVHKTVLSPDMAHLLEAYMIETSENGTAQGLKNDRYQIASKTGSAENPQGDAHAWYVGYAPIDQPEIAIAIIVENVGSSSVNAVPIAKELYDLYLGK